jgi:hypothetical protein
VHGHFRATDGEPVHQHFRETDTNGNGGLGGLPPWLRGIAVVGIPGAIALFLVWMGAKEIPRIVGLATSIEAKVNALLEHQRDMDERQAETFRLMQRICSNAAKTEDDRARCFDK